MCPLTKIRFTSKHILYSWQQANYQNTYYKLVLKYLLDISELHNQQNLTVNTYDVLHILRHPCVGIEMGGGERNV